MSLAQRPVTAVIGAGEALSPDVRMDRRPLLRAHGSKCIISSLGVSGSSWDEISIDFLKKSL